LIYTVRLFFTEYFVIIFSPQERRSGSRRESPLPTGADHQYHDVDHHDLNHHLQEVAACRSQGLRFSRQDGNGSRRCSTADVPGGLEGNFGRELRRYSRTTFPGIFLPAANTTPCRWRDDFGSPECGYQDLVCVQKNRRYERVQGEDLNNYVPIFKRYGIRFSTISRSPTSGGEYRPRRKCTCSTRFIRRESRFRSISGKNIVHLPPSSATSTHTTGAMKNAFGGLLNTKRTTPFLDHKTLVDLLAIQKESTRCLRRYGRTTPETAPVHERCSGRERLSAGECDQVAIDAVAAK